MTDRIVRNTHESYGDRISGSCKALCMAPVLLVIGILILVSNEGNLVSQRKALDEGLRAVVDVTDIDSINPSNEGKLIHFVGTAITDDQVSDQIFGIAPTGALKLKRKVEMYQWVESQQSSTKKNTGGSTSTVTTYSYKKQWSDKVIDSNRFEEPYSHENPSEMFFSSDTMVANPITVGAFHLNNEITNRMGKNWFQPIQSTLSVDSIIDDDTRNDANVYGNQFYFGSPSNPQVGDTRVSFEEVPSQIVSIVAQQVGTNLYTYTSKSGGSVLLVEAGPQSAKAMFQHANQQLTVTTWMVRLLGLVVIFFAFSTLMKPLSVMVDVIPFLGTLVEAGNDIVSLFLATVVSILAVALAWLSYRPLVSFFLFAVAGGIAYLFWKKQTGDGKMLPVPIFDDYEIPTVHALSYRDHSEDYQSKTESFL